MYYLVFIFPCVFILSTLIYLPIGLLLKKQKLFLSRKLCIFAFIGMILMLLYATIFWYGLDINFHPDYHLLNLHPFIWMSTIYSMGLKKMLQQLILNICMFIPLGFLLPILFRMFRKFWTTLFATFLVTLFIEVFQYFIGRSADIDDLIMNIMGGILGFALYALFKKVLNSQLTWNHMLGTTTVNSF